MKVLLLAFILSCSSIQMMGGGKKSSSDLYSSSFTRKINEAQNVFNDGLRAEAIRKIAAIKDTSLKDVEKSKKYNLLGVIHFSNDDLKKSLTNFGKAYSYQHEDEQLKQQILLNLAGTHYKMRDIAKSEQYLNRINSDYFSEAEKNKYYKMKLMMASRKNDHQQIVSSILGIGKDLKSFDQVEDFAHLSQLRQSFNELSETQKVFTLEKNSKNTLAAYLAKEEALFKLSYGDKGSSTQMISWLSDNFGHVDEVSKLVESMGQRLNHFSKLNKKVIGVVLPMSGKYKKFGVKALKGIESALTFSISKRPGVVLETRDSMNNPSIAMKRIKNLIEKKHASIIVGGLFSKTAKDEYLVARKYGALFISLSSVNLPTQEKNHLLIEIPGSIQSQIFALSNPNYLAKVGSKVALLYPNNETGSIYADEIWDLSQRGIIQLTSVNKFETGQKDYRDPVSKLLGLKYTRERKEEYELWQKIIEGASKSSVRRKQVLRPEIDFDWAFVPALPKEAIKIVPTFGWFDAEKIKIVGVPSWTSRSVRRQAYSPGKVMFLGDDKKAITKEITNKFYQRNKSTMKLVETISYEAVDLALKLNSSLEFEGREDFSSKLQAQGQISGLTSSWSLKGRLWIKKMNLLSNNSGKLQIRKF